MVPRDRLRCGNQLQKIHRSHAGSEGSLPRRRQCFLRQYRWPDSRRRHEEPEHWRAGGDMRSRRASRPIRQPDIGERFMGQLIVSRASVHGFLVFDWWHRRDEALRRLAAWYRDRKIRFKEDVLEGIERMPEAFLRLLSGKNFGKQIVKIS